MSENMEGRSEERRKKDKRKRAWKKVNVYFTGVLCRLN